MALFKSGEPIQPPRLFFIPRPVALLKGMCGNLPYSVPSAKLGAREVVAMQLLRKSFGALRRERQKENPSLVFVLKSENPSLALVLT